METKTQHQTKTWALDPMHSSVHFAVRHMVISETKGDFKNYKLNVLTNELDFEDAKVELEIDVKSISTGMPDRDKHLLSADFFDAEGFPSIKFVSDSFKKVKDEEYLLMGNITIKETTKSIELKVNYGGQVIDPWGNLRAGFTIEGSINRFDFGLTWNSLMETGSAVVGKIVKISSSIELVTQK
ncbi:MAG: YceI family protein [Bacteroidia bacterium]